MYKKKIVIRCLSIPAKGYGNIRRCLYIAESLRKNAFEISFIIDNNKNIVKELEKRKFKFVTKPKINRISTEVKFILDYIDKNQSSAIILDMREYGEQISKFLVGHNFKTILFDDAWCKNVYVDLLFNGTNVKSFHNYIKINKNSKLFLGIKYWILDNKFLDHKKNISKIHTKKLYHVIISMGGSDPNNLTINVINAIIDIQNIKVSVIVGPLFHNILKLKIFSSNNKIKFINSTNTIWKEFSKVDVAISNGGNTLFELATLGIPTLCIPAFKHEIKYANEFMSKGFTLNLGLRQKNPTKINEALVNILDNIKLRKKMSKSGNQIIDGNGLSRVTSKITKFLK